MDRERPEQGRSAAPAKKFLRRHYLVEGATLTTATLLRQQFQMNHWAAHTNLQGISHDESLVRLEHL